MQFTVPKFIEHKAKIIGPLGFGEFLVLGGAVCVCFVVYLFAPLIVFIAAAIFVMAGDFVFAFAKIEGRSIPTYLQNMIAFKSRSKLYIWKQRLNPPKYILVKKEAVKPKIEEKAGPKVAGASRLRKLATSIDIKSN